MDPKAVASHDYLRRLSPESYRGRAYIHWSMTVEGRQKGWLDPTFSFNFREILTHTMFRYALVCPIYCLMPDHLHLLWIGLLDGSDQRDAMKFFRKHLNAILETLGYRLQKQPYDHVLGEEERNRDAFETAIEYVARNPERAGLVAADRFRQYPFTGCLVPGYPELNLWQADYWERFWRIHAHLTRTSLFQFPAPPAPPPP